MLVMHRRNDDEEDEALFIFFNVVEETSVYAFLVC